MWLDQLPTRHLGPPPSPQLWSKAGVLLTDGSSKLLPIVFPPTVDTRQGSRGMFFITSLSFAPTRHLPTLIWHNSMLEGGGGEAFFLFTIDGVEKSKRGIKYYCSWCGIFLGGDRNFLCGWILLETYRKILLFTFYKYLPCSTVAIYSFINIRGHFSSWNNPGLFLADQVGLALATFLLLSRRTPFALALPKPHLIILFLDIEGKEVFQVIS